MDIFLLQSLIFTFSPILISRTDWPSIDLGGGEDLTLIFGIEVKMSIKNKTLKTVLPLVPKNVLSQWVGKAMEFHLPNPARKLTTKAFVDFYHINMEEAELPLAAYSSIGDLFTRRLKPGVRPLGPTRVVHPADGVVAASGTIRAQTLVQAKGIDYSVMEFIRDNLWSKALEEGEFMTTYLCPTDYHRVHSPVEGKIEWVKHIPGDLWPVNELYVSTFPRLFVTNERVVIAIQTPFGKVVVVMVGATNVGKMSLSFDKGVVTNTTGQNGQLREVKYSPGIAIAKGDELGVFHMGSTVVALYEKGVLPDGETPALGSCKVRSAVVTEKARA